MPFTKTSLYDFLTIGVNAAAFILLMKMVFVGFLKIPGLTQVAAAI